MIFIRYQGRFGNRMLTSVGASILARKHNLRVHNYAPDVKDFGVDLFEGGRTFDNLKKVGDVPKQNWGEPFMNLLEEDKIIDYGMDLNALFQQKDFVLKNRSEIRQHFKHLEYSDVHKNDLFIHVRGGDVSDYIPPYKYYNESIKNIDFDKGFISSDSPNHNIVQKLISEHDLKLVRRSSEATLKFGKNFGNIILTGGTFSWWIGFLSRAKNIYYPMDSGHAKDGTPYVIRACGSSPLYDTLGARIVFDKKKTWSGDIFVFPDWVGVEITQ